MVFYHMMNAIFQHLPISRSYMVTGRYSLMSGLRKVPFPGSHILAKDQSDFGMIDVRRMPEEIFQSLLIAVHGIESR